MSKKKVITIAVSVVLVAAAAALIVSNVAGGKQEETVEEVPPVVSAEHPEHRQIVLYTELIGTIEPDSIVYVTPKGAGAVSYTHLDVYKRQPIYYLRSFRSTCRRKNGKTVR